MLNVLVLSLLCVGAPSVDVEAFSPPTTTWTAPSRWGAHHIFDEFRRDSSSSLHLSPEDNQPDDALSDRHGRTIPPNICILGGGFGGLNTALTLANLPWPSFSSSSDAKPRITLIDNKERFVFLPLLYELCVGAASLEEVAPTYESLLEGSGVDFVKGEVWGVDVDSRVVHTTTTTTSAAAQAASAESNDKTKESTTKIPYDALVIATGSSLNLHAIPGASEFALPFYTVEQCYELRRQLNVLDTLPPYSGNGEEGEKKKKVEVVVVGGGYSGVELALNTLERLGGNDKCQVTVVHRGDEILQYATEHNRKMGQERLEKAGIEVMMRTSVEEIVSATEEEGEGDDADTLTGRKACTVKVMTKSGGGGGESSSASSSLHADLFLWTAGSTSTNDGLGVLNSLLPRDAKGRIVTDNPYLRVKGHDTIFALGDCARARKVPYAATAQVAMQQAPVVAWNVYATLSNEGMERRNPVEEEMKLLPFNYLDLGEMMTLGNDDATISSLGGLVEVSGLGASVLRRMIYAVRMPTGRQGLVAALESMSRRLSRLGSPLSSGKKGSEITGRKRRSSGKPIQWK